MWGCLQPCSSTIYAIVGNSKSSNSEMVLFGSELVKLLGAGAHYYKWFLASKYGYLIHLNDCEENQVTMWVFLWPKCWKRWILRWSMSTYVLWDGKFNRDFLPDEYAICFGADGEGQYLHQLHVFSSSTRLDAWDSLYGTGHKEVVHHFLMPCVPKTMPPFLPHSSSLLPPVPQFLNCMWITVLQSFVLCPHPILIVSTCCSPDIAFWKHS